MSERSTYRVSGPLGVSEHISASHHIEAARQYAIKHQLRNTMVVGAMGIDGADEGVFRVYRVGKKPRTLEPMGDRGR